MSARTLRILHLSDLHLGKETSSGWRLRRVIGTAWAANLRELAADRPIDLVCFTGDLAQSGQPAQYARATAFVDELLAALGLPRDRFFCVPGNHDIDRDVEAAAWQDLRDGAWQTDASAYACWMAGAAPPPRGFDATRPDAVIARQRAYRDWLAAMGLQTLLPSPGLHPRLGWRVKLDLGLGAPLHLIGFDSAWLAGDNHDAAKLRLTDEQVARLLSDGGQRLTGWSIALMHHPPGELADGRDALRLMGEYGLGLLLHGHLHDPELARWATPAAGLHVAAAGCLYESDRYPNSFQLLDLTLRPGQAIEPRRLWARTWSPRGFWHNDNGLYPGSVDGRLDLAPAPAADPSPFAAGTFVGRDDELRQLCAALLPADARTRRPTVVCCAIEGMPGVGKTRLAEHFVQTHWLPAVGAADGSDPADHVQRLVLDPLAPEPPTALSLAQRLADLLRSTGPADTIWQRLSERLQSGPGGAPWLLLVENVDSAELAAPVAAFVNGLPGCPILVTARYRKIGGQGWTRVAVAPMPAGDARALLQAEVDPDGHPLGAAEADLLARELGCLPLALHIAASHLSLGWTPAAFLAELHRSGLGVAPARPGDAGLTADRARAILQSSFDLSWRHWCKVPDTDPAWPAALVALAHGPAAPTGPSLSAAIAGIAPADYVRFAVAAMRLSLLQYAPQGQRSAVHPLIAEFLRAQPLVDAAAVLARMRDWFMQRLPDTEDAAQGVAHRELWDEFDALSHWLSLLSPDEGLKAERAGKEFAWRVGPFNVWKALCQRLIASFADHPAHSSNLWWTLSQVAQQSGDLELALKAADLKAAVDRDRGAEREWALARSAAADVLQARGELDEALRIRRDEELPVYDKLGDVRSRAVTMGQIADVLQARGELDEALRIRRDEQLPVFDKLGDVRSRAVTMGKIADVLQARGELDEALRIRRDELLPVFDKLGDVRSRAVTMGQIADVLQARGELDEALRIRRDELLPVFDKLGDVRERAVTMGKIADVLQARGELDEALRIRRDELLPVYDKLGDVRSRAVTMGQIADVLQARGELDEALRIRRDELLPVFDKLGDVRSRAVTMGKIADVLQARGQLDEALRIRRDEQLPVYDKLGDVRERAVTMARIADVLQARGELDEALRIRRDEVLRVFDRLGDVRELLVGRAKLALCLLQRALPGDRDEAARLLALAHSAAEQLKLPEAAQIGRIQHTHFADDVPPAGAAG